MKMTKRKRNLIIHKGTMTIMARMMAAIRAAMKGVTIEEAILMTMITAKEMVAEDARVFMESIRITTVEAMDATHLIHFARHLLSLFRKFQFLFQFQSTRALAVHHTTTAMGATAAMEAMEDMEVMETLVDMVDMAAMVVVVVPFILTAAIHPKPQSTTAQT